MKKHFYIILFLFIFQNNYAQDAGTSFIRILGITQDGGYPHAGCNRKCCEQVWQNDSLKKFVVSFALVDSFEKKWWLFEATPDIKFQLQYFRNLTGAIYNYLPDGIFITHAHIGHYAGLMEFGKEVMDTKNLPLYVLPRMKVFLETNGPWSQLVKLNNIVLNPLSEDAVLLLSEKIKVETFRVPHRDEFSETAGFKIITSTQKYLFIPDIDKWDKWNRSIIDEVKSVDVALLDGTFFESNELPGRKIIEVPHPLITETTGIFNPESRSTKEKIFFIHLNHTNPLLWNNDAKTDFKKQGFGVAEQGQKF
ncbi:MAG: MBL fold metallo-hydrolase [Bacteroidia bacterium]